MQTDQTCSDLRYVCELLRSGFATARSYILDLNHPKINKIGGTTLDEGCSKSYELMQLFGHGSASSEYDCTSTQHGPTLTWCTWWFRLDHGWLLLILIANFHGNQCLLIWWWSTPIIADPISASRGSCLGSFSGSPMGRPAWQDDCGWWITKWNTQSIFPKSSKHVNSSELVHIASYSPGKPPGRRLRRAPEGKLQSLLARAAVPCPCRKLTVEFLSDNRVSEMTLC